MAISNAITDSFKQDLFNTNSAAKTFKMALYWSNANLSNTTTTYITTNEVTGTNYSAGGVTMSGFTVGGSGATAWIDWTTDPQWTSATISYARGCLIYNSTDNKAVASFNFGTDVSCTNGNFTVVLPTADASNAVIRIS